MYFCCECYVLSGRVLCDELITRPEEYYRLWCVVMCDQGNLKNEETMTHVGSQRHRKQKQTHIQPIITPCLLSHKEICCTHCTRSSVRPHVLYGCVGKFSPSSRFETQTFQILMSRHIDHKNGPSSVRGNEGIFFNKRKIRKCRKYIWNNGTLLWRQSMLDCLHHKKKKKKRKR